MDQTTTDVRLANWKSIVEQCSSRPEGMSIKQWCSENSISEKQYYYWQRKVRAFLFRELPAALPATNPDNEEASNAMPVPYAEFRAEDFLTDQTPALVIKTRKSTIEVSASVSDALIIRILKAVSHAL